MHKGTTIDELIAVVARAEAQARTPEHKDKKLQVISEPVYPQFVYAAPFVASVMGAA